MRMLVVCVSLFAVAVVGLLAVDASGQSGQRTPWGDADLQGTYSFKTTTPLERPESLGDKEFLTDEEVAAQEQAVIDRNLELQNAPPERATAGGNVGAYNNFWMEAGTRPTGRTSIVSDPRNGRLPAPTPAGQRRHAAHRAAFTVDGPFDSSEEVELNDRCLLWLAGPPLLPTFYNNNVMLLETPDDVVLYVEMVHDTRIIPLDGRPGLVTDVRHWLGDGRGRWEGDTLVVETRNIRRTEANESIGGAGPILLRAANGSPEDTLTVTERFRWIDADTLHYEFTIRRSHDVDAAFLGRTAAHCAVAGGAAVRVRLSRGQLRPAEHPRRRTRQRAGGTGVEVATVRWGCAPNPRQALRGPRRPAPALAGPRSARPAPRSHALEYERSSQLVIRAPGRSRCDAAKRQTPDVRSLSVEVIDHRRSGSILPEALLPACGSPNPCRAWQVRHRVARRS